MFYEAIYTRCGRGIDLEKNGQPEIGDGFHVYSCSNEIFEDVEIDMRYLNKEIQAKPFFSDPDFMDDAYIYHTPRVGAHFFVNFHPIPFDPNVEGNFAKRRGNTINQVLIGDFSGVYPFELFNDAAVWNAKGRGEAYYYETAPSPIAARTDVEMAPGQYTSDDIRNFISDGRKDALKRAIVFLIDQASVNETDKKYLVIYDDSTRNIELWISAIESAFSPRIASNISFATRMDSFINRNRIKTDEMVVTANDKRGLSFRSQIVGVVKVDKANAALATRVAQNSPFVLLDGTKKTVDYAGNINDTYFDLITSFGDEHISFLREFVQTFDIKTPSSELFTLYKCYKGLVEEEIDLDKYANIIERLSRYQAVNSDMLAGLYNQAKDKLDKLLEKDISGAVTVMNWLRNISKVVGDEGFEQTLEDKISHVIKYSLFVNSELETADRLWSFVKVSQFGKKMAETVTNQDIIAEHAIDIARGPGDKAKQIADIYIDACKVLGKSNSESNILIAENCAIACSTNNEDDAMNQVASKLDTLNGDNSQKFWIEIAKKNNTQLALFIVNYLVNSDKKITASEKNITEFCKTLHAEGYSSAIIPAIRQYINVTASFEELIGFLKRTESMPYISEKDIPMLYKSVDDKLDISLNGTVNAAKAIQDNRPTRYAFPNSAHIMALYLIGSKKKNADISEELSSYSKQGFPSINNTEYQSALITNVLRSNLNDKELVFVLKRILTQPESYYKTLVNVILASPSTYKGYWNRIMSLTVKIKDSDLQKAIYNELAKLLADTNQSKKTIGVLGGYITDDKAYEFFNHASHKATEIIDAKPKTKGLFGLFRKK